MEARSRRLGPEGIRAQNVGMFPHPNTITKLGLGYRRYGDIPFGIRLADRMMHLYVIGQTGTGKSTLLLNSALQDARAGIGLCLVDPHGDLAAELSARLEVPHIAWNVADPESPFGYNPVTHVSAAFRPLITSGLIDALKRQWSDAWGARMEHLLRYALLALLEQPSADIRDILRLYVEKDFRQAVVKRVSDPQVLAFWTQEFPKMNYQTAVDGVAPIANKLGAFLANPVVRKAICAPEEPLRFRRIMDRGEILIINLAKGRLGSDSANVLGGLIVSSLMNAAFSRHDLPEQQRRPFLLYVDEFHSFTTGALAAMMSETRKYGLGLVLAHQHIVQTEREVFEAVLGNAGSLLVFRTGALDAPTFAQQLGNVAVQDLVNQPNYQAFVQLMVDGQRTPAFTATTLPPPGRSEG
ncbi:AAA-like domain-containing protein [Aliiruegeria lutimaris]|uniref:AAA-like domain-containing protein n=2 Tax=Aliiruegeria lutimaris TaxID=571298 RepID=A0A1G9IML5_9RHOB|nr:AAA-like domain-containing protein [Aliiruegeria lutimaris]